MSDQDLDFKHVRPMLVTQSSKVAIMQPAEMLTCYPMRFCMKQELIQPDSG